MQEEPEEKRQVLSHGRSKGDEHGGQQLVRIPVSRRLNISYTNVLLGYTRLSTTMTKRVRQRRIRRRPEASRGQGLCSGANPALEYKSLLAKSRELCTRIIQRHHSSYPIYGGVTSFIFWVEPSIYMTRHIEFLAFERA
jgi:hypothetical protein